MKFTGKVIAGMLIFIGASMSLMGIVIAEALSPGYHVSQVISDLGVGQTAAFFNLSIIIFGGLFIAAAYLLRKAGTGTLFCALMALTGVAQACVGIFPETLGLPHQAAAAVVFLSGCSMAILSYRVFPVPWAWVSAALGVIILAAIILLVTELYFGLGKGGMERIIVYPLVLWALGSGAMFMAPEK
ncbi:MAG TPA: DUF998 domain-containing protein [Methanoregula sp.]|nr:DUF998 domain-containing protein [Methanoregula sp.]